MTLSANDYLAQRIAARLTPPFRGEIWESDATVPMGKGYKNDGKPFDISTACYLKPVFRGIRNPDKRKVVLKAGIQSLKTFATEKSMLFFAQHDPGEMTLYDSDIAAAKDHVKSRIGPFARSLPGLAEQIAEVESENRFEITTREFYLSGMTLRFWPLNESSVARMTLRYVGIHDAYLSKSSGMIEQAIGRTTQHPLDKKIIIESQGSDAGDDFDRQWETTDQGILHVRCPLCNAGQPFEFERLRPEDHPVESLRGKYSGFKRGDDETILLPDGGYNAQEVLRQTYYECYDCGGHWSDTPEIRAALDESSYYVSSNPKANPEHAGFWWPNWINRRIRWGSEEVMLGYLTAKRAHKQFGNADPLKQWYQKRAAQTWNTRLTHLSIPIIAGSQRIEGPIPDEVCRVMFADAQQDDMITAAAGKPTTGHFWWVARAIDKFGNMFQLDRGYATSWADLIAAQDRLQIHNQNLGIDCAFYTQDITDMAAEKYRIYQERTKKHGKWREQPILYTWTLLKGDDGGPWKHADKLYRSFSEKKPQFRKVTYQGQQIEIQIPLYLWSNLLIKDQLSTLLAGGDGRVKFESLARSQLSEATRQKESGDLTYENQMSAEFKTIKKNGQPFWDKARRHNHYWDCESGCLVLFGLGGFLGVNAAPPAL